MTADLVPIEPPPRHPDAARAYAVLHHGQIIGHVFLIHTSRPHGARARRDWWAVRTVPDRYEHPRPFDSRNNAAQAMRYQYDRLTRTPVPGPPDVSLQAIEAARRDSGTAAALWLAASITRHHISELAQNRTANPPALWRELGRISAWLEAATAPADNPHASDDLVHYRRFTELRDGP